MNLIGTKLSDVWCQFQRRLAAGPRARAIVVIGGWSLLAKVCAAANMFGSVPLVMHSLGASSFGVWATLVSLVAFSGFLDFGIGNGVMNLTASASAKGDDEAVLAVQRVGLRTMLWISATFLLLISFSLPLVHWHVLLGQSAQDEETCRNSAAIVLYTIAAAIPLNLVTRIWLGLGRGATAFQWQAGGQVASLAAVYIVAQGDPTLARFVAATVALPLAFTAGSALALKRHLNVKSHKSRANRATDPSLQRTVLREGILFFVLQLAGAIAFASDLALITYLVGSAEAGTYALAQRLFSVIPIGLALLWTPLWPIYRHSLATGQHAWVLRTLRRSTLFSAAAAALGGIAIFLGYNHILSFWVHAAPQAPTMLIGGMVVWAVIDASGNSIATFLNAASVVRFQVIVGILFAIGCLAAKVAALKLLGTYALPWATSITYLVLVLVPTALLFRNIIRHTISKQY